MAQQIFFVERPAQVEIDIELGCAISLER